MRINFLMMVYFICIISLISGCASANIKQEAMADKYDNKKVILNKQEMHLDADTVVVRAKWMPRLELLKKKATRRNNRDTVTVIAGTAGAIAAYTAANSYFSGKNSGLGAVKTLTVTAAAACAAAAVSGFIYDMFNRN